MDTTPSAAAPRARWLAVGSSTEPDSRLAGQQATRDALEADDAKLLIVFAAEQHDLDALLTGINETSGGVPLIGCSTAGEISPSGPIESSVVVTAIGGPGFSVQTSVATGATGRQRDAGAEAAAAADRLSGSPYQALLLLVDGATPEQEDILRGVYAVVGASMPLVGGCAGTRDESRPTQLYGDRVLTDAVVAAAIGSDAPIGIAARHGWTKVGDAMTVTGSRNGRVLTFNDEPALDLYLRQLGAPPEAYSDLSAFADFAATRPLGIRRRSGDEVRDVHGEPNFTERSLHCGGEITEGGLVWCMAGDAGSAMQSTDAACEDALAPLDGCQPLGLIVFDCVSRRRLLGESGVEEEVRRIAKHAGGAPIAGFYTWGEIARTRGINGFHHQTLVVLAMA
jgi:hypothetical protein